MIKSRGAYGALAVTVAPPLDHLQFDNAPCETVLDPLIKALTIGASTLSLHFGDGGDGCSLLGASGQAAADPVLTAAMLDGAARFVAHSPAFHDRLTDGARFHAGDPAGQPMLSLMFHAAPGGSTIVLTASFAGEELPDRKPVAATLRRFMPTLDAYYGLWQRAHVDARQNAELRAGSDSVDLGVILVDRNGAPRLVNAAEQGLLSQARFLRQRGSALHASDLGQRRARAIGVALRRPAQPAGVVADRALLPGFPT